jgi:hypothetical protein
MGTQRPGFHYREFGDLLMAEEKKVKKAVPTFVLRADRPGAVKALVAALAELGVEDDQLVREFELAEERGRA